MGVVRVEVSGGREGRGRWYGLTCLLEGSPQVLDFVLINACG